MSLYQLWRLFALVSLVIAPTSAVAQQADVPQQTRAEIIAEAQAAKSATLTPYVPSKAERLFMDAKRRFIDAPGGFYPWFDSVYSGGGFTLGGGYRHFYGDRTFLDARGLYSMKNYKRLEL